MKNNLYISIIAIILIFIYWKNKRDRAFYDCANVWDSINNPDAQGEYVNESNNISNDPDAIISIETQYGSNNTEYGICITAFSRLKGNNFISDCNATSSNFRPISLLASYTVFVGLFDA